MRVFFFFERPVLGGPADPDDKRTAIDDTITQGILDRHKAIFDNFRCT